MTFAKKDKCSMEVGKKELTDKKNILFSTYRESNMKNTVAHKAHSLPCVA